MPNTNEQTELLRETRDLLRVIAEPSLAQRDQRLRKSLREVVGKGKSKAEAVLLMDGTRSQASICKHSGIDDGNLSRLVKALRAKSLLANDGQELKLAIAIPANFFSTPEKNDE